MKDTSDLSWFTASEELIQEGETELDIWTDSSLTSAETSSKSSYVSSTSHSNTSFKEESDISATHELPKGLILRTTADDVFLMGTLNGKLELLSVLPGLVVDWEGQQAYRGLNSNDFLLQVKEPVSFVASNIFWVF